ncbi:MAG TPA: hypothetical protein VGL81_12170 [Polyangiaceae bacterium]|jgi:hypothetical protein
MDERRAYLKQLASQSARRWSASPLPPSLAGETRIETRNTVYQLREGVCYEVSRHEGAGAGRMHPSAFVGMRLVGWLMRDDPHAGIALEWKAGAYAVLWRPRQAHEEHSAVALTSTSHAFRAVARRLSTPPPLPRAASRSTLLPQPVTPPSWIPPVPASTTRLHLGQIPPAPETPTPAVPRRVSSMPPPLPTHAQGVRPLQLRVPG